VSRLYFVLDGQAMVRRPAEDSDALIARHAG
jgi:hypothetical protein